MIRKLYKSRNKDVYIKIDNVIDFFLLRVRKERNFLDFRKICKMMKECCWKKKTFLIIKAKCDWDYF